MNKYLMLSAAAVLGTTAAADAGTLKHSFVFASINGQTFCDGGTVYTSGATIWSWQHDNCGEATTFGQGLVGKNKTLGLLADNYFAQQYGIYSTYLNYVLPGKLKTGKPWSSWVGFDGTSSFENGSGIIVVVGPRHKAGNNAKSTTSALKQLVALHRAEAKQR